jgi:hypothetical protein
MSKAGRLLGCFLIVASVQMNTAWLGLDASARAQGGPTLDRVERALEFDAWYGNSLDKVISSTSRLKNFWSGSQNRSSAAARKEAARQILTERRGELIKAVMARVVEKYSASELNHLVTYTERGSPEVDPKVDEMLTWIVKQMGEVQVNALFNASRLIEERVQTSKSGG